MRGAAEALRLVLFAAIAAEAAARTGAGLLPLASVRRHGPLERFGLGLLAGWSVLGAAWLGLALAGLWFPGVLLATALLLPAATRGGLARRPLLAEAVASARAVWPRAAWVVLALLAFPALPELLSPEREQDAFIYHLGAPWQYLLAHKAVVTHVPAAFHLSLPFEMVFGLALALGDDRLGRWIVLMCAAAGFAAACAPRRGDGPGEHGWLAPAAALASWPVLLLATRAKNDMAAAACFLAGAALTRRGSWTLGACFLGMDLAAKQVHAPVVAAWCLAFPPPRRRVAAAVALLSVWMLPWSVKTWLATGNPVLPFGAGWFPSPEWDHRNAAAHRATMAELWEPDTLRLGDLANGWTRALWSLAPALWLVLPGLAWFGPARRPLAACALAQLVVLAAGHRPRYMLPAVLGMACAGAEAAGRLPGRWRMAPAALLALAALGRLAAPEVRALAWGELARPRAERDREALTTFGEALRGTATGRLLLVGEMRTYPVPARALCGGTLGETPLVWKLAREAADEERMARRVRQLGAREWLYNYVSADFLATRYAASHPWDDRMLRLYRGFARRRLEVAGRTETNDFANGGFVRYRLRDRPADPAPATVWFLPGTEGLYAAGIRAEFRRRPYEALAAYREAVARLPDVGHARNQLGHALVTLDSEQAYRALKPFVEQDMLDQLNYLEFGDAAVRTGRWDEGERALREAVRRTPVQAGVARVGLANVCGLRAGSALARGRLDVATRELDRAEAWLMEADAATRGLRSAVATLAEVRGFRGMACLAAGEAGQAAWYLREALRLGPELPDASRWRAKLEELSRRVPDAGSPP